MSAIPFGLHPEAAKSFSDRAEGLLQSLHRSNDRGRFRDAFPSEIPAVYTLNESNSTDFERIEVDQHGLATGRFALVGPDIWGIEGPAYRAMCGLAQAVQIRREVRERLGQAFIERSLFRWLVGRCTGAAAAGAAFLADLQARAAAAVAKQTVWTPVVALEVEHGFPVAGVEVLPISKSKVDTWIARLGANGADALDGRFRTRYQGRAAVVGTYEADPEHAADRSRSDADRVCAMLALFSPAMLRPEVKSYVLPMGREARDEVTVLIEVDGALMHEDSAILGDPSSRFVQLSAAYLRAVADPLGRLSKLATIDAPSDMQARFLSYALLHARAAFVDDPTEKAVLVLSSLESFLLKSQSEPISQNLGERLALLVGSDLQQRKRILQNLRDVYALRSGYLHHGRKSLDERESIVEFLHTAIQFLLKALPLTDRFDRVVDFLDFLDDVKLGGAPPRF